MPELLSGPASDIEDVCRVAEQQSGWPAMIVEKDLWVTWVLGVLFDDAHPLQSPAATPIRLAFKGGTSLSKAYGVITRFSEDVDLTMHFEDLGVLDKPMRELSRNAADRARDDLNARVAEVIRDQVVPRLRERIRALSPTGQWSVEVDPEEPLNVFLRYPHVVTSTDGGYLREDVRLEFGGRNVAVPANTMDLSAMVHTLFPDAGGPTAAGVQVLLGEYTFWEKVTLAHAELIRDTFVSRIDRMSRHWSDLSALSQHDIGRTALARTDLLNRVIEVKSAMFRVSRVDYRDVARGRCRIAPSDTASLQALRSDYVSMQRAGMLGAEAASWEAVLARVEALEHEINSSASADRGE